MMERFCKKCISFFISNNLIKSEYEEVYCYALNIILSSLIHIATVIVLGRSFDLLLESLVYYFSFISVRKFAGGGHTDTPLRCYIFSVISTLVVLGLMKLLFLVNNEVVKLLFEISGFICVIIIAVLAPLDTEAKPLGDKEKRLFKKIAILNSFILLTLSAILMILECNNMGYSIVLAIYMSLFVLLLGKIKNEINL